MMTKMSTCKTETSWCHDVLCIQSCIIEVMNDTCHSSNILGLRLAQYRPIRTKVMYDWEDMHQ